MANLKFINFCSYNKCSPRATNCIPFLSPTEWMYDTFVPDLHTFTQIRSQKEMLVQFRYVMK